MGMRTSDLALLELSRDREDDSVCDSRSRELSRSRDSRSCSRSALREIGASPLISSRTPLPLLRTSRSPFTSPQHFFGRQGSKSLDTQHLMPIELAATSSQPHRAQARYHAQEWPACRIEGTVIRQGPPEDRGLTCLTGCHTH